jgi:hypothetical protein
MNPTQFSILNIVSKWSDGVLLSVIKNRIRQPNHVFDPALRSLVGAALLTKTTTPRGAAIIAITEAGQLALAQGRTW